jgi:hypothetical protein
MVDEPEIPAASRIFPRWPISLQLAGILWLGSALAGALRPLFRIMSPLL